MSKNSIVFKDVIFYLRWYNVRRWSSHISKKSSFVSFHSFLGKFNEWHKGPARVKLAKYDNVEWGENCHYASTFWMTPSLICYFIVILFYIERKWRRMRNLAIILPLKSELPGKFQRFNTWWKYRKLKKSWISKNFNWNEKL